MAGGRRLGRSFIGTSGWNYGDWRGDFYPPDLPSRGWLEYYSKEFGSTEINYTFYHLPRPSTYENWSRETPTDFVFAVKASRVITHLKRLHNVAAQWRKFALGAKLLGDKLGPILLQFPPRFAANTATVGRLKKFLERVSARNPELRLAFEFRDKSWFEKKVLALLRRHDAALVVAQSSRYPVADPVATAPFAYYRFHGPRELFASPYSDAELRKWARQMKAALKEGRDVYAYFNNDAGGHAHRNARRLRELMAQGRGSKLVPRKA